MKKYRMNLLSIAMLFAVGMVMSACGDDDDEGNGVEERTDDSVPTGTEGTKDMFGYYSDGLIWKVATEEAEERVKAGQTNKNVWSEVRLQNYTFRIVDGHVIYWVYEEVSADAPSDDAALIHSQSYTVSNGRNTYTYTLYHSIFNEPGAFPEWQGRYSMNGETMTVKTEDDTTWMLTYSGGQIIMGDRVYTKVK